MTFHSHHFGGYDSGFFLVRAVVCRVSCHVPRAPILFPKKTRKRAPLALRRVLSGSSRKKKGWARWEALYPCAALPGGGARGGRTCVCSGRSRCDRADCRELTAAAHTWHVQREVSITHHDAFRHRMAGCSRACALMCCTDALSDDVHYRTRQEQNCVPLFCF